MSAAGFLEKLLDGADVVWVPLGDESFFKIANTARRPVKASLRAAGEIPYYGANNIQDYVDGHTHDGEYVLIAEDGSASLESYSIQYVRGKFWANNHVHVVRGADGVDTRFLFHYLTTANFLPFLSSKGRAKLTKGNLVQVTVPIPCPDDPVKSMAIQGEIVRILDTFTELTAELTAELTQRKKQYNHYRNQLLTFDEGEVEWKTLGEVSLKSYSGATPTAGSPKYYDGGSIPWLRTQEVIFGDIHDTGVKITQAAVDETAAKWVPENCVIIAISGATAGRSGINKIPLTTNQHCCCLEIDPKQANYRYVFHWVSRNYENLKEMGQGARGDLNSGLIKGFKIPIPYPNDPAKSIEEQARIVAILDTFDTLTTSISEGLPREIELREKQYAYYRDQLLSFPKPDAEAA
ncbi:restriction endonuclease subunit S [Zymomonas mobilis]|uniref:Putative type I restriction-modification system specificity protein n=1 Tax=Zymomonas mobilis subsp. pomaceae (strain ATCC 29192 / DSM 22645 / JCM 10191 / CCUG 17912 / NBRC 13757 / NCIMB 11200 / NRRL B-4491 / Barker I) TaxID=579138 RepID=F8EWI5_ZYMMT|nr:restriction endonuclease subunit S [Zymomonas mobilis]AEI38628.1 putative type I restriction-modification system specificity protein [Zymomonas mobilis subsp. pomaceae ATCC 29192]MDX5947816.1 restriction endonuclease subunit S [Zymomonas mobilis subsp. pomaceae]GEB90094.1 putative type I restriction enzyme specificity protein [Zymomonas mobilis subsp. pomaceae]